MAPTLSLYPQKLVAREKRPDNLFYPPGDIWYNLESAGVFGTARSIIARFGVSPPARRSIH
jgi:hypothetical protein